MYPLRGGTPDLPRPPITSLLMFDPFVIPPSPAAQHAAREVIEKVHAYMQQHPQSELHTCGKMFGVLVYEGGYIAAFSAKLDGSYFHEGFVPPAFVTSEGRNELADDGPVGHSKEESQRLQRLLFAQYNFVNGQGESKNLLEIFRDEKPIIPPDEWFGGNELTEKRVSELKRPPLPPSGAGDCCAPKLLQYAFTHGLQPVAGGVLGRCAVRDGHPARGSVLCAVLGAMRAYPSSYAEGNERVRE